MLYISLATRGRPDRLVETVKRSSDNWTQSSTEMHIQVDDDDAATIERCDKEGWLGSAGRIIANVKPREDTIADKWNRIHTEGHGQSDDVYLVAADDDPYVTKGYDQYLNAAAEDLPDSVGWVYGHLANLSFTGALAATKGVCDLLGFFLPNHFPYWFCDHWIDDVARISGRISFANVKTDQSRPGKTQEMREPAWWATFYDACYLMRRKQAHEVIFSRKGYSDNLPMLLRNHPLVEVRSRLINEQVRAQSRQMEQWSGLSTQDERYQRVKARAIKTLGHALDDYGMPEAERAMFARYLLGEKR